MKNYLVFKNEYENSHESVIALDVFTTYVASSSSSQTVFQLMGSTGGLQYNIDHTNDAALAAEFVDNVKQAILANPGGGKINVPLPKGFEITFIELA